MTKAEAVRDFKDYVMPAIREAYEADGVPDYVARSEEWNNFTDALCKSGEITTKQYESWTHPAICGR